MNALHRQGGLSLVEILVALAVSLLLLAGVTQIFLGTRQSARVNENLAQVQESGQFAIELMARTIRMAGATGCPNTEQIANTLKPTAGSNWWIDLTSGWVRGFDEGDNAFTVASIGTGEGERTANSDAIYIFGGSATDFGVESHSPPINAIIKLKNTHNISDGEILIICDSFNTSVFQVTNANPANKTLVHNTGNSEIPGNCSKGLGYPTDCTSQAGNLYEFKQDAIVSRYSPVAYYIGNGSNGRPALFMRSITPVPGSVKSETTPRIELVQNVENMQLTYADNTGSGITASAVGNWSQVHSVRVELLVGGTDTGITGQQDASLSYAGAAVSNTDKRLRQVFTSTVGIRNRLP